MESTSFTLKVIDLAVDEDGDPIRSLVARQISNGQVVQAMHHEAERGRGGSNHLFLELALHGIEEKKLRVLFYEATEGEPETKRKAYFRARKWAIGAQLVEVAQGIVLRSEGGT